MIYPLCNQTVTVYRLRDGQVERLTVENCCYTRQERRTEQQLGHRWDTGFQLILPGSVQKVFRGDRIYDGVGPEITAGEWPLFLPARVQGLAEVSYVKPLYWGDRICHWEAGRK